MEVFFSTQALPGSRVNSYGKSNTLLPIIGKINMLLNEHALHSASSLFKMHKHTHTCNHNLVHCQDTDTYMVLVVIFR